MTVYAHRDTQRLFVQPRALPTGGGGGYSSLAYRRGGAGYSSLASRGGGGDTRALPNGEGGGYSSLTYRGGGIFRAGENMNLQILARQNLCHFLKVSEQMMYGSQQLLMRNSGRLLLLPPQILENTEQIAYKIFAQNLKCRNSSLYNPPPAGLNETFLNVSVRSCMSDASRLRSVVA